MERERRADKELLTDRTAQRSIKHGQGFNSKVRTVIQGNVNCTAFALGSPFHRAETRTRLDTSQQVSRLWLRRFRAALRVEDMVQLSQYATRYLESVMINSEVTAGSQTQSERDWRYVIDVVKVDF